MTPAAARRLGLLAAAVVRIWKRLYRTEVLGWEPVEEVKRQGTPIVFCLWHGSLFAPILHHANEGVVTMASRSADGEVITRMLETMNFRVARGSTGKGGGAALDEMVRIMAEEGRNGALTVDGPRGPVRTCLPGAVKLARATGAVIVPIGCESKRGRRLASWDRFHVPLPFDRVFVTHGRPFPLDPSWSDEECALRIAAAIDAAEDEAMRLAGRERPVYPPPKRR